MGTSRKQFGATRYESPQSTMSTQRRVVITGVGVVSPIGTGVDTFWKAALAGTNGVRPLTSIDATPFRSKIGGEVRDFDATKYLTADQIKHMGRSSQFAVTATKMAMADAGLSPVKLDAHRLSVSMGTTMGEPQILEQAIHIKYDHKDAAAIPAGLPRQYPCGVIAANVAREVGARGTVMMIPTACAAGNYAIGYAGDLIRMGRADVVVAGGSDPFSKIAFTGFNRLLATALTCVRPFSKNREGMAVSEGAGMLIIEELAHAKRRGAHIYAELLGYGLGCDAHNMTIPAPDGCGGILAMQRAFEHSHIRADEVDYVCAHGTGTGENDKIETLISKQVFGSRAAQVPMSSLKGMLGHTMGAASAIEAAACALMIEHQTLLPTINYDEPDPECDLDYVPNQARQARVITVVSSAYAFGGNTSAIVLRKLAD
jgi:3-oxoacyl-[acyl-carrier-protein] synthase II